MIVSSNSKLNETNINNSKVVPVSLLLSNNDKYEMQFDMHGSFYSCVFRIVGDSVELDRNEIPSGVDDALVLKCVQEFHESRRTMFENSEPMVNMYGNPVISTKRRVRPHRLIATDQHSIFQVEAVCDGLPSVYTFNVNDHIFVGVEWDDNFWQDTGGELHVAKGLFNSIIDLYKLRRHP